MMRVVGKNWRLTVCFLVSGPEFVFLHEFRTPTHTHTHTHTRRAQPWVWFAGLLCAKGLGSCDRSAHVVCVFVCVFHQLDAYINITCKCTVSPTYVTSSHTCHIITYINMTCKCTVSPTEMHMHSEMECVCVCACVRACACACMRAWASVCACVCCII